MNKGENLVVMFIVAATVVAVDRWMDRWIDG
jgi:hypothetical protein